MARIKIKDLPKDMKISRDEMKSVLGGLSFSSFDLNTTYTRRQWSTPRLKLPLVLDTTTP
jgi:hypothetical protein